MPMMYDPNWSWYGLAMAALMMVGWIVPIALVLWFLAQSIGRARNDASEQILRERFAKGEIDAAEFDARRRALGYDGPPL